MFDVRAVTNGYMIVVPTLDRNVNKTRYFTDTEQSNDLKYSKAIAALTRLGKEYWGEKRWDHIRTYGAKTQRSGTFGIVIMRVQAKRNNVLGGFSQVVQCRWANGKKQTFGFSEAKYGKTLAKNLATVLQAVLRAKNTGGELNLHPVIVRSLLGEYDYMYEKFINKKMP